MIPAARMQHNPLTSPLAAVPWLRLYRAGLGAELTQEHGDMLSLFAAAVSRHPDRAALVYFDRVTSYAQLDADTNALAVWLLDRGLGRGDRVSVITQNAPAFAMLCVAAWKIGAVPVPSNPMYRRDELSRVFADSEPSAVVCQDLDVEEVQAGLEKAGLATVPLLLTCARDGQTRNDMRVLPAAMAASRHGRLTDVLERHRGQQPPPLTLGPGDLALILYTSGTTGVPKGAMLLHRGMAFNSQVMRDWSALTAQDRILALAPLFHVTGLICHMGAAFSAGCSIVLNYRFEPQVVVDLILEHRPSFTVAAITAFNSLMRVPAATPESMRSLRKVFSGGAPIPPALRDSIKQRLGLDIYPAYGMTELTAPAILAPLGHAVPQRDDVLSIGIPVPSTQVIVADEQGIALRTGEVGEILVRGPQVMGGYWQKPEETETALAGGWMHTGDVGFMDEQGWIYLVDRKKDMIIASGFKVWPREVEDVLYTHPAVREAAVIGVSDSYRGENVKACVSLVPGANATEVELIAYCRERLAAYKVPRVLTILDDLPKTITGKIQRAALREDA
jgi:long-chain acyl-CoA synthetase